MAKLTALDVTRIAKLAKLDLTPIEVNKFQKQLVKVVDYFEELKEVDTSSGQPTSQTTGLTNVTRPDEINPGQTLSVEQALSGTDSVHNNFFKVPAILEGKSGK